MNKKGVIVSFDKTERTMCEAIRPEKYEDIFRLKGKPIIARGAGLSYCNAGVASDATVVDMTRMNRILNFDKINGFITVESGQTIGTLNNFLISHGWILPVLPGYPTITIGGCIAFNIHGKSQFKVGTFGAWVEEIQLFHPTHGEIKCSKNEKLLDLTIGGMGLTGIILSARLRLKKLSGGNMQIEKRFVKSAYEAVEIMQQECENYEYVYSWNNMNLTGDRFGQGVVYFEKYTAGNSKPVVYRNKLNRSYRLPGLHNSTTIKLMCNIYYLLERMKNKNRSIGLAQGSFPIYNKEIYFNLFGKKGFREYQVLFPTSTWRNAMQQIEKLLYESHHPVALGSLKIFNGNSHHLSFSGEGVCITLDIMENKNSINLCESLDEICLRNKGIINLCKDSRITGHVVEKLFEGYATFRKEINEFDISNLIRSNLKSRLNLIL